MDGQRLLSLPHVAAVVLNAVPSLQWVLGCRYTTVVGCLGEDRRRCFKRGPHEESLVGKKGETKRGIESSLWTSRQRRFV